MRLSKYLILRFLKRNTFFINIIQGILILAVLTKDWSEFLSSISNPLCVVLFFNSLVLLYITAWKDPAAQSKGTEL